MPLAIDQYGAQLLSLYPDELRPQMAEAFGELCLDAVELAQEVRAAEAAEVSFAEAARQEELFPRMAQVHFGVLDLLQLELPRAERELVDRVLAGAGSNDLECLRRRLFLAATDEQEHEGQVAGSLMRFLLYQAVRLNVWVATWSDGATLEASGALRRLDDAAEVDLRRRLTMVEMRDPGVRPLQVLVAEALGRAGELWDQRREELLRGNPEQFELFEGLIQAAQVARDLGAGDAALVRNELEGATGGRQLESRPLAARCSLALRTQNCADQRRRRLLARLRTEGPPAPSGDRFIDLIL